MNHLKNFSEIHKEDATIAGGKGASLGEMTNAGIPVPPGFVVLASAFDAFLLETDIKEDIEAILTKTHHEVMHEVEDASEKIQEIIISQELPEELKNDILSSFKSLGAEYVAVRSSATAEDGAEHAWAGQLDTYLNTTEEKLLENVKKCWASLFTPRAIFYRFEKGLAATHISVAVVVQKMVESEFSGIAFSVHPVTEDRNQMIIEAGYGLGEAIVSGQVTPDSYVVTKSPREIIDVNVSEQSRGLYRTNGGGNEWRELGVKGGEQVLNKEPIIELGEIIMKIENHYGFPCDIEWAYEKGKFFITQSRPITTLSNEKTKVILEKVYTRERPLFYYYAFPDADKSGVKKYLNRDVNDILFFLRPKGEVGEVWYPTELLHELKTLALSKINNDPALAKEIIEDLTKAWNSLSPYFEGDKKIEDGKEAYQYYSYLVDFWAAFNTVFFELIDNENLNKSFVEEIIRIRDRTQEYTAQMSTNFIDFFESNFPKYSHLSYYVSPYEIKDLKNGEFSKDFLETLEERARVGCFVYKDKLLLLSDLQKIVSDNNLILKQENLTDGDIVGQTGYKGKVTGVVKLVLVRADLEKVKDGDILVSPITDALYVPAMHRAAAFVTDEGGIICHAAIVARELKKPCVIGTKIATQVLKDGDLVEVDAEKGVVRILEKNETSTYKKDDYEYIWGGTGFNLLFQSIFYHSAKQFPFMETICFFKNDELKVFTKKNSLRACALYGKDILSTRGKAEKICEQAHTKAEVLLKKDINSVDEKSWSALVNKMIDFLTDYLLLDPYFSDVVMSETKDKEYILYLGEQKNLLRKNLNDIFFTDNSVLTTYLKHVGDVHNLTLSRLSSCTIEEIEEIINSGKVGTKHDIFFIDINNSKIIYNFDSKFIDTIISEFQILNAPDRSATLVGKSIGVSGKAEGRVKKVIIDYANLTASIQKINAWEKGFVMVTEHATPELLPAMKKATAIITEMGGMLSHAAITSREIGLPCVVGVSGAIDILKDGDLVEVDAEKGVVRILESGA